MRDKKMTSSAYIKAGLVLFLFIITIWPVYKLGYPVLEGKTLEYWANAGVLSGNEFWKTYLVNQSDTAFGYSVLLMILGKFIKNPVYLYKIMLAGNALLWTVSYLLLVKMTGDTGKTEKGVFILFLMTLPFCLGAKVMAGPEAILLVLFLLSADRIGKTEKEGEKALLQAEFCLIAGLFFHSSMIAVIGGFLCLCIYKRKEWNLSETSWLKQGIFMISGILIVIFLEQILSFVIWGGDMTQSVGVLHLPVEISNGADKNGWLNLLFLMVGKFWVLLTGSLFLILPGILVLAERRKEAGRDGEEENGKGVFASNAVRCYLLFSLGFSFLSESLRISGEKNPAAFLQDDFLWIVALPVAAGSIFLLEKKTGWIRRGILWIVLAAGSAGIVSDGIKKAEMISGHQIFEGIDPAFYTFSHGTAGNVILYTAICLVIMTGGVAVYCLCGKRRTRVFAGMAVAFLIVQTGILSSMTAESQKDYKKYREMAEVIQTRDGVIYGYGEKNTIKEMALIQTLSGKEIRPFKEKRKIQSGVIIPDDQKWRIGEEDSLIKVKEGEKLSLYLPKQEKQTTAEGIPLSGKDAVKTKKTGKKEDVILIGRDGMEELEVLAETANAVCKDTGLGYVARQDLKEEREIDYSELERVMPEMDIYITTPEELSRGREFTWLILKGYAGSYQELLEDYTVLKTAGEYSLLVRQNCEELLKNNTSGRKTPVGEKWNTAWKQMKEREADE